MGSTSKQQPGQSRPPPFGPAPGARLNALSDSDRRHLLADTLTRNVIPRLVRAHSPLPSAETAHRVPPALDGQAVLDFAHAVLHEDDAALHGRLDALRRRGFGHERILLELLAPVARHMGRLWEHDLCDFHDVTLTVGRLQRLLRNPEPAPARPAHLPAYRILLAACPGEQHTFGLSMVAEFFHEAGWDVATAYLATDAEPLQLVRQQWFDVAGLTLGSSLQLDTFSQLADGLRRSSQNRQLPIISGGSIFMLHPELSLQLMIDAVISDASQAPAQAERLLSERKAIPL